MRRPIGPWRPSIVMVLARGDSTGAGKAPRPSRRIWRIVAGGWAQLSQSSKRLRMAALTASASAGAFAGSKAGERALRSIMGHPPR